MSSRRWSSVRLWGELFALSWRADRPQVVMLLGLKLVSACTTAALALSTRAVIDQALAGHSTAAMAMAGCAALAAAATVLGPSLETHLSVIVADSVAQLHLEPRIQRFLASVETLEHLEHSDFLDRVTVLDHASWKLTHGLWSVIDVVFAGLRLLLLMLLLGTVSPVLLPLLVAAGVALALDQHGQRGVARAETDTAESFRLQRHLFTLATQAATSKEIWVAGVGGELARRQRAAWDEAVVRRTAARLRSAGWRLGGWLMFSLCFAAGLVLVLRLAATGQASAGDVVLTLTVAVALRDSVQSALVRAGVALNAGTYVEPYLWLRDYVARHRQTGQQLPAPAVLRDGIAFEGVTFTYPGTTRPVLDDVSFHLAAGSVVAIVGEFGSGKTSLVKLLTKFYTPDAGTIRVDGTDLSDLDTEAWRSRCSAAFQDFGRFRIRFAETVGLGDLPHADAAGRLADAVAAADADGLVRRLPNGMDTQLGRLFGGVELSGGQWQKTALARASMRQGPLLFVLDEPTASLDAPSEGAILERYMVRARELAARTGAVTVIVSHRFSTIAGADQILVFGAGRIMEAGTHAELLALGGRYADLYGIQARAYTAN
ncbi:ABC transporter ATP-binding protein [Microbispora triticiradicis]|nr:ABC transporter ATP-binding protein [Microbispora triticiradicis]